jgi:hypothetical protein
MSVTATPSDGTEAFARADHGARELHGLGGFGKRVERGKEVVELVFARPSCTRQQVVQDAPVRFFANYAHSRTAREKHRIATHDDEMPACHFSFD